MYYYNNELPPQQGWICPKCGRVNAPWMPTCGCVSSQTSGSGTPYLVKTSSISRDSHEIADTSQTDCENCEHITEDGVTCAKYPACDDCPDNPLNKIKGSERLVKGSEQTEEFKNFDREDLILLIECQKERIGELLADKDTPQKDCLTCRYNSDEWDSPKCDSCSKAHSNYEPQTDCPWK